MNLEINFGYVEVDYLGPVFAKNIIIAVTTRCIKLTLSYLHVVRQEQLYLIW